MVPAEDVVFHTGRVRLMELGLASQSAFADSHNCNLQPRDLIKGFEQITGKLLGNQIHNHSFLLIPGSDLIGKEGCRQKAPL